MRVVGIEIQNNDKTTMVDVVTLNEFVFGFGNTKAFEIMLKTHRQGAALAAVIPSDRLAFMQSRLDTFNSSLADPVGYLIVEEPQQKEALFVDFGSLLDWEVFSTQRQEKRRKRKLGTIALVIAILTIVPIALVKLI